MITEAVKIAEDLLKDYPRLSIERMTDIEWFEGVKFKVKKDGIDTGQHINFEILHDMAYQTAFSKDEILLEFRQICTNYFDLLMNPILYKV